MFLGHFGAGYGAKATAPAVSLGTLFLAVQFLDLLWATLLLLDIEQVRIEPGITAVTALDFVSYPVSHSLFMVCIGQRSSVLDTGSSEKIPGMPLSSGSA